MSLEAHDLRRLLDQVDRLEEQKREAEVTIPEEDEVVQLLYLIDLCTGSLLESAGNNV